MNLRTAIMIYAWWFKAGFFFFSICNYAVIFFFSYYEDFYAKYSWSSCILHLGYKKILTNF